MLRGFSHGNQETYFFPYAIALIEINNNLKVPDYTSHRWRLLFQEITTDIYQTYKIQVSTRNVVWFVRFLT